MIKFAALLLLFIATPSYAGNAPTDCDLIPSDICPLVGDTITFTCTCPIEPDQYWVYDDPNWTKFSSSNQLSVTVTDQDFIPKWECWTKVNGGGNGYFETNIFKRPSAVLSINPDKVLVGDSFVLTATVDNPGNVNYIVKFLKQNIMIEGVEGPANVWTATVNSATEQHAGDWVAQIWSVTCNTDYNSPPQTLEVFNPPTVDLTWNPNPVTEGFDTTATIVINNPDETPITKVELKDSNGNVRRTWEDPPTDLSGTSVTLTLNLSPATLADGGDWTVCVYGAGVPSFPTVDDTATLTVNKRPTVELTISPNPVFELDPFTVSWVITNVDNLPITQIVLTDPDNVDYVVTGTSDRPFLTASPINDGPWVITVTYTSSAGPAVVTDTEVLVVQTRPDDAFTNDCNKEYVMVYRRMNRYDAAAYCRSTYNMTLAPVLDTLEIQKIAVQTGFNDLPYHTGYTRSGSSWRSPLCTTDVPWPNSRVVDNGGDCIWINTNGEKESGSCDTTRFFLCMEDMQCEVRDGYPTTYNNHKYYAINWMRNQAEADQYCKYIDSTGGLMTVEVPPEMQQACEPLISGGLAGDPYWTAPISTNSGSTYSSCSFTIPAFWFNPETRLIDNSNASGFPDTTKCTAIVLDVMQIYDCGDCHRFFCEIGAC